MAIPASHSESFKHVLALEGKDVLYVETLWIVRAHVSDVATSEAGFQCKARALKVHGLPYRAAPWTFSAGWDYFSASSSEVSSSYGGWRLYPSREVFNQLARLLEPLGLGETYRTDYTIETTPGGTLGNKVASPGPIARSVLEFVRLLSQGGDA